MTPSIATASIGTGTVGAGEPASSASAAVRFVPQNSPYVLPHVARSPSIPKR